MTTTWKLTGITKGRGTCDHCGRTLARLFRVTSPDGAEMVVGRTCSANLTGYNWSVAQAERAEGIRVRTERAAAMWPELFAALVAIRSEGPTWVGDNPVPRRYAAHDGELALRDYDQPGYWMTPAQAEEFARQMLAKAAA